MTTILARRTLSLLVALLAAGALIVSGCGGDDGGGGGGGSSSGGDAESLLKQAFSHDGDKPQSGDVKVDLSADFDGGPSQLQQPLRLQFSGPVESKGKNKFPELDWDINAEGIGQRISGGVTVTADNAYVRYGGKDYEVGKSAFGRFKSETESQSSSSSGSDSLTDLNIDPNDFLTDLKQEDGEPVDGIATERVTGTVDVEKLIRSFSKVLDDPAVKKQLKGRPSPKLTDDDIKQIKDAVKGVDFSIDIDKQEKVVRRLSAAVDFKVPVDARSEAGGLKGGKLAFKLEVGKLDPGTEFKAPSGARPLKELTQQLGLGLLGGALGGASGGTPLPTQ